MIDLHGIDKWCCATNATDIFHINFCGSNNQFTTAQPYVVCGDTEDELMAKVFVDPHKEVIDDEGREEYILEHQTPKSSQDIINAASYPE